MGSARFLALLAAGPVLSACGGDSKGSSTPPVLPSCAGVTTSTLKLEGNLDGESVHVVQSPATGGYSQLQTGEFDTPFALSGPGAPPPDPNVAVMHLQWSRTVADGDFTNATGTFTLPSGAPRAGQALCAGGATEIYMPSDGSGLQFAVRAISVSPGCSEKVLGEVTGCWGNGH